MPAQVAVCGPARGTETDLANAHEVGRLLAQRGAVVLCGAGTGVMAAVAAGVRAEGGVVIGIWSGGSIEGANPALSAVVVTNMGEARNAVIVRSADAVIAIGGSWGTLSEVALAKRRGDIPVVTLGGWSLVDQRGQPLADQAAAASSPRHAVELALVGLDGADCP